MELKEFRGQIAGKLMVIDKSTPWDFQWAFDKTLSWIYDQGYEIIERQDSKPIIDTD